MPSCIRPHPCPAGAQLYAGCRHVKTTTHGATWLDMLNRQRHRTWHEVHILGCTLMSGPLTTNHLGLHCPGGRSSPPCSFHSEEIWTMALHQLL